jgi:hypothetical protein
MTGCASNRAAATPDRRATRQAERTLTSGTAVPEATSAPAGATEQATVEATQPPVVVNATPVVATPIPVITSAPGPSGETAVPPPPPPSGSAKVTRGVFAITGHDQPFTAATFSNPAVDGIVIRTFWSDVEPSQGQYNWSFIDSQVQAASAAGKKVILIVLAGAFCPQWALQGVQTATFSAKYGFIQGQPLVLPMPWDSTYLNRWFQFVAVLGQRYDPNPAVVMVPATGPNSVSAEMSLPDGTDAVAQWQQLGYTPQKFESAWQQTITAYAQAFPTSQVGVTLYPGLPIPNASASDQTRTDITSFAVNTYGGKITVQTSGLSARKQQDPRLGYQLVAQYSSRTTVGFEMGTSATDKPSQMGGSNAESALKGSIDFGLQAGARFLEIYEKDIDNPALLSILQYAHSALLR